MRDPKNRLDSARAHIIPIALAARPLPNFPRLRALALFSRRSSQPWLDCCARRLKTCTQAEVGLSIDQLVGTQLHLTREREAEGFRSLEVDHQLIFGGRLHGQVARLFSL